VIDKNGRIKIPVEKSRLFLIPCKESRCAWWITGVKECAVNSLAQSVDCLVENGLTVKVMEACHED